MSHKISTQHYTSPITSANTLISHIPFSETDEHLCNYVKALVCNKQYALLNELVENQNKEEDLDTDLITYIFYVLCKNPHLYHLFRDDETKKFVLGLLQQHHIYIDSDFLKYAHMCNMPFSIIHYFVLAGCDINVIMEKSKICFFDFLLTRCQDSGTIKATKLYTSLCFTIIDKYPLNVKLIKSPVDDISEFQNMYIKLLLKGLEPSFKIRIDGEYECKICYQKAEKTLLLKPCGHTNCCMNCWTQITQEKPVADHKCPLCKQIAYKYDLIEFSK